MRIERFNSIEELKGSPSYAAFNAFLGATEEDNFFQSPEFLEFIGPVKGYRPMLLLATNERSEVVGSLLAAFQEDGGAIKAMLSRRLIVWGGPIGSLEAADALIGAMLSAAKGRAIYVEFRNFRDMSHYDVVFKRHGVDFNPHLNFTIELSDEAAAKAKLSSTRRREVKGSQAAGAEYGEAKSEKEVHELYSLLEALYRDKVGKPLPSFDLFKRFYDSPSGRVFVVRYDGRIIGGSAGPVYKDREVYHWYVCGDNSIQGVHASVLATWAQIEYAAANGYALFDFMGAGRPGQGYGVHDFKARFGGTEVAYGRYHKILNEPLYKLGVWGLDMIQRVKRPKHVKK